MNWRRDGYFFVGGLSMELKIVRLDIGGCPKQQTKGICGHCYQGLIWVSKWWLLLGEYVSGYEQKQWLFESTSTATRTRRWSCGLNLGWNCEREDYPRMGSIAVGSSGNWVSLEAVKTQGYSKMRMAHQLFD